MNPTGRQCPSAPFDSSIEVRASEWLLRRDAGLDRAEERDLANWLAADARHEAAWARLTAAWTVFDRAHQTGATDAILAELSNRARRRRSQRMKGVTLAAAIVVAVVGLRTAFRPAVAGPSEIQVAFEPIQKLPDGSIVELNSGAEISVQYSPGVRRVRLLHGEAHFQVAKNASRPFLVQAGNLVVRAVGTAFAVQVQPTAVEVVVTEGRVALDKPASPSEAIPQQPASVPGHAGTPVAGPRTLALVDAGNRILVGTAPDAEAPQVSPITENQIDERLAWRVFEVKFAGIELSEAIALMNRANRLQLVLGDAASGRLRISGVFHVHNPEGFARIVEGTFDLKAESRGENEILLRRAP